MHSDFSWIITTLRIFKYKNLSCLQHETNVNYEETIKSFKINKKKYLAKNKSVVLIELKTNIVLIKLKNKMAFSGEIVR